MASDHIVEFTDTNFDNEVIKSGVPVVVDFWAEWCQPCRKLAPTIDELASKYDGRAKVGKLDTDSNQETAFKYNIQSIPTVLFFKDGEVQNKIVGFASPDAFETVLDEMLG